MYEWNYARQMVEIRLAEAAGGADRETLAKDIFDDRFLIKRPILQALEADDAGAPVLLIDELDRTDEPFEAFLLEVLSDFQVTIPELGPIVAEQTPIVIITSNRTREIHDALKRRCFYYWVDYPSVERELEILKVKAPNAPAELSRQVVAFVHKLRGMDLFKVPGVAETIDWTHALVPRPPGARSDRDRRHAWRAFEVPGRHCKDLGLRGDPHSEPDQTELAGAPSL